MTKEPSTNINTTHYWNKVYALEGANSWRTYPKTFSLISNLIEVWSTAYDIGGGVGILAAHLRDTRNASVTVVELSSIATSMCQIARAIYAVNAKVPPLPENISEDKPDYIIATEFLEHLNDKDLHWFLDEASKAAPRAIYTVPDNRLGSEDEPEHVQKFDEETLRELLERYYSTVSFIHFKEDFTSNEPRYSNGTYYLTRIELPTLLAYVKSKKGD